MTYTVQDHRFWLLYAGNDLATAKQIAIERESYFVQFWENGKNIDNKYVYDVDFPT